MLMSIRRMIKNLLAQIQVNLLEQLAAKKKNDDYFQQLAEEMVKVWVVSLREVKIYYQDGSYTLLGRNLMVREERRAKEKDEREESDSIHMGCGTEFKKNCHLVEKVLGRVCKSSIKSENEAGRLSPQQANPRSRSFLYLCRAKMTTVPGQLIWEIVKRNNCFLVKEFGNGNAGVRFTKEPNNLYNLNSYKYSGLANKKTVTIQPAGKDQGVLLATTKSKKQNKPSSVLNKSIMKKEFHRMAKAVSNQVLTCHVVFFIVNTYGYLSCVIHRISGSIISI
ncbi:hypothetical protein AgCh_016277 [Apium graveolens]